MLLLVYNVLDHFDSSIPCPTDLDDPMWKRLDGVVKQWIYDTIYAATWSNNSYERIYCIRDIDSASRYLPNNKNSRELYLENTFTNVSIEQFPNANAYYQRLKSLGDQLANVGHLVSHQQMVLCLISSLHNSNFLTVATIIQQLEPLPTFAKARLMLLLDETRPSNSTTTFQTSFVA